jgi:NAD(P)-dependent dehydrogenase (short-subunit alcohol dehydrogenase family)
MNDLTGKVAFISGGGSGIGLGMARAMAAEGMKIALADIDEAALASAAASLRATGAQVLPLHLDVCKPADWTAAADRAEAELGPVQVLCSNAGVAGSRLSMEDTESAAWLWTFDINVHGAFHGIKTFLPRMRRRGEDAHIIVTSSLGGFLAHAKNSAYSATKAAVIAMCESLRGELAQTRIGVSVLCPGLISTNLLGNNRRLAPASIDHLCEEEPELVEMMKQSLDPRAAGELVVRGIRENRFWLFTHPELRPLVQARSEEILAAMPVAL